MPRQFDLVIFDWDGTLMDSTPAIAGSIQRACADLGLPVPSDRQASHVIGLGLSDSLAYAVPSLTPALLPRMLERYRHHYLQRQDELVLFEGIAEMLAELRAAGHHLAVATGKNRIGLDRVMRDSGLSDAFHATRCADETRSKPDPAMLFELLNHFEVAPQRAVMIGDTSHDLLMAARAGTAAVGVTWGAHPGEELRALSPLACHDHVNDLRAWLRACA